MSKNVQMVRLATAAAALYVGPVGQIIMDLGLNALRVQDGVTPGGFITMIGQNNLGDLTDKAVARTTLGLGSAALHDAGDFALAALLTMAESDGADGYFYLPRLALSAKPWLIQWKRYTTTGWNPTNQPAGSFGASNVIVWPIDFPNAFRFGGASCTLLVANGNYASANLLNVNVHGGTVFTYSGQSAANVNGLAWGVGN